MPFDGVEIELGLVRRTTDAPLVDLGRDDAALVGLLLVQWAAHLLVDLQLRRRAHLGVLLVRSLALVRWSKLILLRRRLSWRCHVHLLAIATSLRPSLDLVLDLLRLLLVRLSDGEALAHLQLLGAVERAQVRLLLYHVPLVLVWRLGRRLSLLV